MRYITTTSNKEDQPILSILPVLEEKYESWLNSQDATTKNTLKTLRFAAKPGSHAILTAENGTPRRVIAGIESEQDIWSWSALAEDLSDDYHYQFDSAASELTLDTQAIALGWQLGCYHYDRYSQKREEGFPTLSLPASDAVELGLAMAEAICLTRDLINTPTNDMGPSELSAEIEALAGEYGAKFHTIIGDELLEQNYPTIHAVGRACDDAPRLCRLEWGDSSHPAVTLVGKGVCFDTGGLNIKPDKSMGLMKKDMGGAAFMLGLAKLIMSRKLPIHLRVYIPAVENSISSNAYRPQDVITTRKGLTVEISNTDAEGRLILCDALAEADSEKPELLLDAATLTGAARVAVGTEIPAYFSKDDALADEIKQHCQLSDEMMWQLPLWEDYRHLLDSDIADIDHAASTGYGGAITAALFLNEFVTTTRQWLHIDMMAWNTRKRPGRPKGGEAQGMRALYSLLAARYGKG